MLGATLSLSQRSGGSSGDVAVVKPLPVPGAVQQGQTLPSNWTMCQTMEGSSGRSRGEEQGAAHLGSEDSGCQEFLSRQRDDPSCAGSRGTESQA